MYSFGVRACIKERGCLVSVERLAGFGVVAVERNGLSTVDTPPLYLPYSYAPTRILVQAHLHPLLFDFPFRSGFAASAGSSDSRMLVSHNLIADFSGQLAHLVFLSQR